MEEINKLNYFLKARYFTNIKLTIVAKNANEPTNYVINPNIFNILNANPNNINCTKVINYI